MLTSPRLLLCDNFLNITKRFVQKPNKKTSTEVQGVKVAQDVMNYLSNSQEYKNIINRIPRTLLKKYKTPETMYLINENTAKEITTVVNLHMNKCSPIVEVNPGFGFLTQELLKCQSNPIYLYESSHHFTQLLTVSIIIKLI